jgi:hypothetical protein
MEARVEPADNTGDKSIRPNMRCMSPESWWLAEEIMRGM